ncbi:uncharacterized protein [Garra rufa]|uniref:uncharacterized protein n=1 Tax=Garra rufa TaxID=137080 RepID=UPI003CCEC464
MHTRKQKEKHFYEVLDWLEKDRPQNIQQFWRCVFDDHMQLYPTLRMLRNSLLDSPIKLYEKPLDIQTSTEEKTEKGKEKGYTREDCIVAIDDPVVRRILPFSPPSLKTLKKLHKNFSFSSPVKKGDEQEIWTWSKYETQLPVTCGDKEDKLTGGGKCILSKGGWFTPDDFEKFWGKETCKNWKFSIRCENILQKKLIEDGCLQCPQRKSEKRTCAQNSSENTEVFTPKILKGNDKDKHKNVYRFECPYAGQFRCSLTSLVFVMEGEGEVLYKTVSWDPRLLDGLGKMEPAGPLYDIDCFDGSISGLYLPHCEIFSEGDMDGLAVAHVTDGNLAKMDPLKVTETHVMIDIKHLSLFGLIKWILFPPSPVMAQVHVFQRTITDRLRENVLDVHLLPSNVPLTEVRDQHVEYMDVEASPQCRLTPGTDYRLYCQAETFTVQPEVKDQHVENMDVEASSQCRLIPGTDYRLCCQAETFTVQPEVKDQHVENMDVEASSQCRLTPGTDYRLCCQAETFTVQPEVRDQHVENMDVEASSQCRLTPGTDYRLYCQAETFTVQPKTKVFELHFGTKYYPTFEVFVDVRKKKVKLSLMDYTERREVWHRQQNLLTVTSGQEVDLPAHRRLTESEFVDKNRHHLIQRVSSVMVIADGLRAKNMITDELYSEVEVEKPHQKQMRLLFKALDSGGASVKAEFYRLLKEKEPHLVDDLDSEASRPQ